MLSFRDDNDGYYQFQDDAPNELYAHLTSCAPQLPVDNRTYADKRRAEYPPMEDYLDAVVKGDSAGQQTYINACLAVKAKYPKM